MLTNLNTYGLVFPPSAPTKMLHQWRSIMQPALCHCSIRYFTMLTVSNGRIPPGADVPHYSCTGVLYILRWASCHTGSVQKLSVLLADLVDLVILDL